MAKLSKAHFFDAGAVPAVNTRTVTAPDGKRKQERWPHGLVEKWVDRAGNVCFEVLIDPGLPKTFEAASSYRANARRNGKVEFHLCPLTQGTMMSAAFPVELSAACPVSGEGQTKSCPHIDHVIATRQAAQLGHVQKVHEEANAERTRIAKAEADSLQAQRDQAAAMSELAKSMAGKTIKDK